MSLSDIFKAYRSKVMSYMSARILSYADAEDLCSEVFERILKRLNTFDSAKASISTWIYTISRNRVIDYYRQSKPWDELIEEIPCDKEIDDDILHEETVEELARAMNSLTDQQRQIIIYHYYDRIPLKRIAVFLGLSYGATKNRHNSALKTLRQVMSANT